MRFYFFEKKSFSHTFLGAVLLFSFKSLWAQDDEAIIFHREVKIGTQNRCMVELRCQEPATRCLNPDQQLTLLFKVRSTKECAPNQIELIAFDARMPEHQHGMNLSPKILHRASGEFEVKGVKLHMSGSWVLYLTVNVNGRKQYMSHPLIVKTL